MVTQRGIEQGGLLRMRVETGVAHPIHLGLQAAADQLRNDLQRLGKLCAGGRTGRVQAALLATHVGGRLDHIAVLIGLPLHQADHVQAIAGAIGGRRIEEDVAGKVQRIIGVVDRSAHGHAKVLQADPHGTTNPYGERVGHIGIGETDRIVGILKVQVAAHPTAIEHLVRLAGGFPDVGAAEVAEVRVGIAHALYDAEFAIVPQRTHAGHCRMETGKTAGALQRQHTVLRQQDVAAELREQAVLVQRYNGIDAVVAAVELHDHQHAILLWAQADERTEHRVVACGKHIPAH